MYSKVSLFYSLIEEYGERISFIVCCADMYNYEDIQDLPSKLRIADALMDAPIIFLNELSTYLFTKYTIPNYAVLREDRIVKYIAHYGFLDSITIQNPFTNEILAKLKETVHTNTLKTIRKAMGTLWEVDDFIKDGFAEYTGLGATKEAPFEAKESIEIPLAAVFCKDIVSEAKKLLKPTIMAMKYTDEQIDQMNIDDYEKDKLKEIRARRNFGTSNKEELNRIISDSKDILVSVDQSTSKEEMLSAVANGFDSSGAPIDGSSGTYELWALDKKQFLKLMGMAERSTGTEISAEAMKVKDEVLKNIAETARVKKSMSKDVIRKEYGANG